MSAASEILARQMHLPRPQTRNVICVRDLKVPMDDGAVLLADRWVTCERQHEPQPTVLVRSPYGRRQWIGLLFGRLLAERGLQVVVQSVRGTFGSEGKFNPMDERDDGLATLRWIRQQPWHAERIGMIGPSYLGLVQWAVAPEAGSDLRALAIQVSASQFYGQSFAGGSISLETIVSWLAVLAVQERRTAPVAMVRTLRKLPALLSELPIATVDERVTGSAVGWFRDGLANPDRAQAYWIARDYAAGVADVTAPVQMVTGWYDILLPWMLEDYAALRSADREVQLVIGPWTHTAPGLASAGLRLGLGWLRSHLLGDERMRRSEPVRVLVMTTPGEEAQGGWRAFETWPPPGTGELTLWLGEDRTLQSSAPAGDGGGSDHYRYDPADPTPSVGGPVLLQPRAVLDNRELEGRRDVLSYSTAALEEPLEALGPVRVELWVRADSAHFDVFARVCDVDPAGVSWNVTDALARVLPGRFETGPDGAQKVAFELWPCGHRFGSGHRIRLQLSSGAHPRFARNPGTGEDPIHATTLRSVEIEVLHGPEHPSSLILPSQAGA